MQTVAVE